jgi:hypothetical protein
MTDITLSVPLGIVKNVYLNVGSYTFSIELVVMDMLHDPLCPIIFGRTFLNYVIAKTDCKEDILS